MPELEEWLESALPPSFVKHDPVTFQVLPSTVKDVVDATQYMFKLIGIDHVDWEETWPTSASAWGKAGEL